MSRIESGRACLAPALLAVFFAAGAGPVSAQEYRMDASVSVAANGQVIVKNALVASASGSTVVAYTQWGEAKIRWVVQTSGSTRFIPEMGSEAAMRHITEGDAIAFSGVLLGSFAEPTVRASVLRNAELERRSASVFGEVADVRQDEGEILIESGSGAVLVRLHPGTLMSKDGGYMRIHDVQKGDSVNAIGTLDTADAILRAERIWVKSAPDPAELPNTEPEPAAARSTESAFSRLISWLKGSRGALTVRDR